MFSNQFDPQLSKVSDTKVFSLSSRRRWPLSALFLLIFVALTTLSMHLSSLMAKNEFKSSMWNPPVEPPGAVLVTRNSFESQVLPERGPVAPQVAAVQPRPVNDPASKPLSQKTHSGADTKALEVMVVEVRAAVDQWSNAWRRQDMAMYLGAYAPQFVPAQGGSREVWAEQRTARITAKQSIRHEVRDLAVQVAQNQAVVKFTQIYADERLQQTDQKTMHLVFSDGRWLISKEVAH
jgi:hypothetical protein